MQGDRREVLQAAHFAGVEIRGKHHPPDEDWRHDRCCDELARPAAKHGDAGQPPVVERGPQGLGLGATHRRVDARDMPVSRHDERAAYPQSRGRIAERGLDRRLVTACNRCAEAEVPCQQLRRILEFVSPLLPKLVVDRTARLQLTLHFARCGTGDEARQRRRDAEHRRCKQ